MISEEKHLAGGTHYHCMIVYNAKLDTRDVRYFDVNGEHPNVRKVKKKDFRNKVEYLSKDGKVKKYGAWKPYGKFPTSVGYGRIKADHENWIADSKAESRPSPFPFNLPDGTEIKVPELDAKEDFVKKRHWLILGPPDCGKSRWLKCLQGKAWYNRPNTKYPFEYGMYRQEQVVVYDDIVPKLDELLSVCNPVYDPIHVYGSSRYKPNYWEANQARVVIWLLNPESLPAYAKREESFVAGCTDPVPADPRYPIFASRFNCLSYINSEWQHVDL